MRTHVGIIRDHSISMRSLAVGARTDFNEILNSIRDSKEPQDEVFVSVVECGVGPLGQVVQRERNISLSLVQPLAAYATTGSSTPLWDSVGMLAVNMEADSLHRFADANLILVITDGQNNSSRNFDSTSITRMIQRLQLNDRWTFVFRVPVGYKKDLMRLGIPDGNIMEWEQTTAAIEQSTQATTSAISGYMSGVARGITSTRSFYTTDLSGVSPAQVRAVLKDITDDIALLRVKPTENGIQIRDFCINRLGTYVAGRAFYQLTKPEKIQQSKELIIKHRKKGKSYAGHDARSLLGLPFNGEIKVKPGDHGDYDIYVQSNSVNRKLVEGTNIIYWNN
jgi:hypothetical protein